MSEELWEIEDYQPNGNFSIVTKGEIQRQVAVVDGEADAHRIASLPKLLEVLETAREMLGELDAALFNEDNDADFLAGSVLPIHADRLREILRRALEETQP